MGGSILTRMSDMQVYTVTMIDLMGDSVLGNRRTPAIFTKLSDARQAVVNNENDLCDGNLYQYAVIEKSQLNTVRPDLHLDKQHFWFKFNTVTQEFEPIDVVSVPKNIVRLRGFGIG
jgi:hypothetical protein